MEILLLCQPGDVLTQALFEYLLTRNYGVNLVTAEQLVFATLWKHFITDEGECKTEIILQNGLVIQSNKLKFVLNRIGMFSMPHFLNATDRSYAETEIFALYASFLKSINHVLLDPIKTPDLIINEENLLLLKQKAIKSGLPVTDYHFTTSPRWQQTESLVAVATDKKSIHSFHKTSPHLLWENKPVLFIEPVEKTVRIVMIGETIIGDIPGELKVALRNFAKELDSSFIEAEFSITPAGYKLAKVDKFPYRADIRVLEAFERLIQRKIIKEQ